MLMDAFLHRYMNIRSYGTPNDFIEIIKVDAKPFVVTSMQLVHCYTWIIVTFCGQDDED